MLRLLLSGCNGRMGTIVAQYCALMPDVEIAAGCDLLGSDSREFPVFPSPAGIRCSIDVAVDFSSPSALDGLLWFCQERKIPLVLATTGHSERQLAAMEQAADVIPIFHSANLSLGANLLAWLVRQATACLGEEYDVEIIERHHRYKKDAPSGTALLLAKAASAGLAAPLTPVCRGSGHGTPRRREEVGISCVRGGGITGDHTVLLAGTDEVLELSHSALNRTAFASGAIKAARFLAGVTQPGLYCMDDLICRPQ
ncbi:4-hydroxy-tetrahydrodipicolinate reductase [Flavonifractor hominis]|uniref:4-hydroxy-tetrahydrodipicolinate reductase n=1 Tax=Flavonifractor hominis TaxID=3133178 RepID=A0ABV1EKW8_9FIRM